jgi:hypothetical protein
MKRRTVLATSAAVIFSGCSTLGSSDSGPQPTEEKTGSKTPACSESDVSRPSIPTSSQLNGLEYPRRPDELTTDSVQKYLSEFESAYARNYTINEFIVSSVNVVVRDFEVSEVNGGFLASSDVQVIYTQESDGDGPTPTGDRKYRTNYYVSTAVYRSETDMETVDARTHRPRQLVACFAGEPGS